MSHAVLAQSQGRAVYGGSPSSVNLGVTIRARVSASCGFSPGAVAGGNYAVGDLERAYSVDIAFSLRCNGPSRVAVVSANGGLLAQDVASAPAGYTRLAHYQLTLALVGDTGVAPVQAACDSTALKAGAAGCVLRGPATAVQGLLLPGSAGDAPGSYIRVSSPGHAGPVPVASNNYTDQLTVTISPAT